MLDLERTLKDFEIAVNTDKELQQITQYFKGRNVLTTMLIDNISYSSLEDLFEICVKFPELKEQIFAKKKERDRQEEANRRAWEGVDMNDRRNW